MRNYKDNLKGNHERFPFFVTSYIDLSNLFFIF